MEKGGRIVEEVDSAHVAVSREIARERNQDKLRASRSNRHAKVLVGRTIGERREKLETKNERMAARKKDKQKYFIRVISASVGFLILLIILIALISFFLSQGTEPPSAPIVPEPVITAEPTIEIIDASTSSVSKNITSRMKNYIGLMELDFQSYGYRAIKATLPVGSIREVDFTLDGYNGYIKTSIDRGAGVTAEDADRMLRYLAEQGIGEFEYIDVRIDGRAFWK